MTEHKGKIGFLGLGNMGEPMAKNLIQAGYEVAVLPHRRREPAERLAALGATIVDTPKQAAENAAYVVAILPNLPEVQEVVLGDNGIAMGAKPGLVLINMSTLSPSGIAQLAQQIRQNGISICDAPVSGGPSRATDGTLTIMAGADPDVFERAKPVLEVLGQNIFYTGELGTGQVAKLCNNMLGATLMAINSEVLAMGVKAGVDVGVLRDIILKSTGNNFQLEHWMVNNVLKDQYEPGFALKLMYKDIGLARDLGKEQGVPMFIGNLVHELYGQFMNTELKDADFSAVSTFYQNAANITIANGQVRHEASVEPGKVNR